MSKASIIQDLSNAWINAVRNGKIVNEFDTPNGEKIKFGLELNNGKLEYFAINLTIGQEIQTKLEEKTIGQSDFVIQLNGFRALKPGGKILKIGKQPDIPAGVNNCRFYCQDSRQGLSILKRDPLIQIMLSNWRWNAYYNATPLEKEGHFLWIPVRVIEDNTTIIPHIPQKLSHSFLEDILILFRNNSELIIFFNSLHGGASVDHIHFQSVFHNQTMAIEKAPMIKKGKFTLLHNYLVNGIVFNNDVEPDEIFSCIDIFQRKNIPLNLVFISEKIYLIPKDLDNEVVKEFPTSVFASVEFTGKIITLDRAIYDSMDYETIQRASRKTTLSLDEIISMLPIK